MRNLPGNPNSLGIFLDYQHRPAVPEHNASALADVIYHKTLQLGLPVQTGTGRYKYSEEKWSMYVTVDGTERFAVVTEGSVSGTRSSLIVIGYIVAGTVVSVADSGGTVVVTETSRL